MLGIIAPPNTNQTVLFFAFKNFIIQWLNCRANGTRRDPGLKGKSQTPTPPARATNTARCQTGRTRGGGVGGGRAGDSAKVSWVFCIAKAVGANKTSLGASGGNSIFFRETGNSDFFSAFLAAQIAQHSLQGCCPSNVCFTAVEKFSDRMFSASIVVHATDCSNAQCPPVLTSSTTIRSRLPIRRITKGG